MCVGFGWRTFLMYGKEKKRIPRNITERGALMKRSVIYFKKAAAFYYTLTFPYLNFSVAVHQ